MAPHELTELPLLRGFDDEAALKLVAERFEQAEFRPGELIVQRGAPVTWAWPPVL